MENNKRLEFFNTRPHRNINFISKHQILNRNLYYIDLYVFDPPGGFSVPAPPVDLPRSIIN